MRSLVDFDADARFASFVCDRAGLECVIGKRQTWNIDGAELTVELRLDRDRSVNVLYVRDGWPRSPDIRRRRSLALMEMYAIAVTGQIRDFRAPELRRFKTKALIEAGLIEPQTIDLPPLPADAPAAAVVTWNLIAEVLTVRNTNGNALPTALSAPWLASLNGTSESTIRTGKQWLEERTYIIRAGNAPGRYGKPTILWDIPELGACPPSRPSETNTPRTPRARRGSA